MNVILAFKLRYRIVEWFVLHLHICAYLASVNEIRSYLMIGQCGYETDYGMESLSEGSASGIGRDLFDDTILFPNYMRQKFGICVRTALKFLSCQCFVIDTRLYDIMQQVCKAV